MPLWPTGTEHDTGVEAATVPFVLPLSPKRKRERGIGDIALMSPRPFDLTGRAGGRAGRISERRMRRRMAELSWLASVDTSICGSRRISCSPRHSVMYAPVAAADAAVFSLSLLQLPHPLPLLPLLPLLLLADE